MGVFGLVEFLVSGDLVRILGNLGFCLDSHVVVVTLCKGVCDHLPLGVVWFNGFKFRGRNFF